MTSIAPSLGRFAVELSLGFVALITLVNLRGVRWSGIVFALLTYGFVAALYVMLGAGFVKCATDGCPTAQAPHALAGGGAAVGAWLVLRAFASGASALTGVEAISNGVSAF